MIDFKDRVNRIKQAANKQEKTEEIKRLLLTAGLKKHYENKGTNCVVMAICDQFEFQHEFHTCIKLADQGYNVVLLPNGYFTRNEKKFDVFLCRNHMLIESDLKCINTKNPDTIAVRIKGGSEQASRLVLDIASNIEKMPLIDGLKSGCERNAIIEEIMLFYNGNFYRLPKNQIESRNIYRVIE